MNRHRCLILTALLLLLPGVAASDALPPIGDVMTAEFALQQGDLRLATRHYVAATRASADPSLAERATLIALVANEPGLAASALARWRTLAPGSPPMRGAAIHLAMMRGEQERALEDAQALLELPEDAGVPVLVSALSEARGDARVIARSVVRVLFEQDRLPANLSSWLRFAGLARRLDDRAFAERMLDAGLARFPDDPRASLLEASRLREAGDLSGARRKLLDLPRTVQLPPGLRRAAAAELAQLGEPRVAARLLSEGPQDDASFGQRATWLVTADDAEGLRRLYRELVASDDEPPVSRRLLLGHVAEALLDWAAAERWYASIGPGAGHDLARLRLARVWDHVDRRDDALALLRVLQADTDADGERVRDSYLYEAEMLARADRHAQALAALDRGLAVFEGDPALLYGRAMQHERDDRVELALADLLHIIQDNPRDAQALNAYGYILAERRRAFSQALPFVERAHALEPASAPILDSLGWIQLRLGHGAVALELLQQAWDLLKDAEIAAHLGEALWLAGREDEALEIWRQGQRIDPRNRALKQVLETFVP